MSADGALTMASFRKSPEPALLVEAWKEIDVVQEWAGGGGNLVKAPRFRYRAQFRNRRLLWVESD